MPAVCRVAFQDVRSAQDTAVSLEYNAGYSGALLMLASRDWVDLCEGRPGLVDRLGGTCPTASGDLLDAAHERGCDHAYQK